MCVWRVVAGKYYYHYGRVRGSLAADVSPSDPLWRTRDDAAHFGLFLWLSGVRHASSICHTRTHHTPHRTPTHKPKSSLIQCGFRPMCVRLFTLTRITTSSST